MDWEEIPYKGFAIWVHKEREGKWIATVSKYFKPAGARPGPDGEAVPGNFDSKEAAVEAAELHIDEKLKK